MAFPYNELFFRGIKSALYISYGAFPVIDAYNTNAWEGSLNTNVTYGPLSHLEPGNATRLLPLLYPNYLWYSGKPF